MDNPLLSAIQRMGSNFLVAAFVPAMGFIVISSITFNELLPPPLRALSGDNFNLAQAAIYLLLFTTVLGFTLFSLSTYIYKAFEGYTFILGVNSSLRRSFLRRQLRRFNRNEQDRIWVEKQIKRIDHKITKANEYQGEINENRRFRRLERYSEQRKTLYDRQYVVASERSENFPPEGSYILPTRFGNILRAAEMYAGTRYAIDSVPLWGRLAHVIPEDAMGKIDEANNQCLFLLNASLLAGIYMLLCLIASAFRGIALLTNHNFIFEKMLILYIALGILAGAAAWFFYVASLFNVSQYGHMIRTAYDLYRFNLIEALHLKLPTTLQQERQLWRRIGYFMVGNDQWEQLEYKETLEKHPDTPDAGFKYIHRRNKSNSQH